MAEDSSAGMGVMGAWLGVGDSWDEMGAVGLAVVVLVAEGSLVAVVVGEALREAVGGVAVGTLGVVGS